jgi:hypothetical protein
MARILIDCCPMSIPTIDSQSVSQPLSIDHVSADTTGIRNLIMDLQCNTTKIDLYSTILTQESAKVGSHCNTEAYCWSSLCYSVSQGSSRQSILLTDVFDRLQQGDRINTASNT